MKFSKKSIEQLVAGKFSQDFIEITLTQQDNTNTEVFTGSGFLYYKNYKLHILDYIEVSVLLEDDYSCIRIKSNEPVEFDQADSIVNTLSVAGCTQLTPIVVRTQTPASNSILLKGIDIKNGTPLMEFLPQRSPNYLNEWIEFIKSYAEKFGTDKTFYYYWLKVFNAHQSDLENETLSLTVSIAGIVNNFHSKFKQSDTDFINLCREVMPIIDKLQI
ncbi:hypothetical protein HFP18_004722, partial [Salmonella enterica]|nr:hypothetical protein [Salmonella enterica subsp. enterica serovar Poona]EIG1140428.1 hypothetical protein [Salmonella enterica]EIG1190308.1 hypothetical protein [Salmonella enterica]